MHKNWDEVNQVRKTVILGQAYLQVTGDKIIDQGYHQDNYNFGDGLAWVQAEDNSK